MRANILCKILWAIVFWSGMKNAGKTIQLLLLQLHRSFSNFLIQFLLLSPNP